MRIDWTKYREVIAEFENEKIQYMIHDCVDKYLFVDVPEVRERAVSELLSLGILIDEPTLGQPRNIVEPFNFMGNDRA